MKAKQPALIATHRTRRLFVSGAFPWQQSYEGSEIALPLPEGWEIVETVRPAPHAKLGDERAALLTALDRPIGSSPLRDKVF